MTWWHLSFSNIFFYSEHGVSGSVSGRQWLTVKPCIRACLFAVTAHMVLGFWSWWLPSLWQIFGFFSLADRNNQILLHLTSVLHINQVSPGQQAIPVIKKNKNRGVEVKMDGEELPAKPVLPTAETIRSCCSPITLCFHCVEAELRGKGGCLWTHQRNWGEHFGYAVFVLLQNCLCKPNDCFYPPRCGPKENTGGFTTSTSPLNCSQTNVIISSVDHTVGSWAVLLINDSVI